MLEKETRYTEYVIPSEAEESRRKCLVHRDLSTTLHSARDDVFFVS